MWIAKELINVIARSFLQNSFYFVWTSAPYYPRLMRLIEWSDYVLSLCWLRVISTCNLYCQFNIIAVYTLTLLGGGYLLPLEELHNDGGDHTFEGDVEEEHDLPEFILWDALIVQDLVRMCQEIDERPDSHCTVFRIVFLRKRVSPLKMRVRQFW